MKRAHFFRCCVVGCSLWQIAVAQQQPTNPMPAAAAGIVAQMDREILLSKKKAADALEKVLKDTTKKGDLAGAMAVKQTLDRLNAEITAIAANRGGRGASEIVGRWRGEGQPWTVEFFPDGTVTSNEAGVTGRWVSSGASVEVTYSNGATHVIEKNADGWAGTSKHGGNLNPVRYVRAP